MNSSHLMFKIKLKTGFFKKEPYLLILEDEELILRQEEINKAEEFRIKNSEIQSITIATENSFEIEIITGKQSFIGEFLDENEVSEAAVQLNLFFGKKFYFN